MPLVIDPSITMACCFEDEATDATENVLDLLLEDEAIVPSLWQLEVTNVLLVAGRRNRINESQAARFTDVLARLRIRVDPAPTDLTAILAAGRHHRLCAYDAAYLTLAERLDIPMATLDDKLAAACGTAGVDVVIR